MKYLAYNIEYSIYKMTYLKQVLNKLFITLNYIEVPNRIRGFPSEVHNLLCPARAWVLAGAVPFKVGGEQPDAICTENSLEDPRQQ